MIEPAKVTKAEDDLAMAATVNLRKLASRVFATTAEPAARQWRFAVFLRIH